MTSPAERGPVRIAYVIGSLARCGTSVHLLALLRELDRARFEPWVVGLVERGPVADDIRALGIRVEEYGLRSGYSLQAARLLRRLARDIRARRAEVVQSYLFLDNMFATIAGRLGGARAVVTGRRTVDEWERPHRRRAYRATNRFVDRIVVVSAEVEASVRAHERPRDGQVTLIRNALSRDALLARTDPGDDEALAALRQSLAGGFVFGTVGNIRPIKGHDILVRAFRPIAAAYPDSHLVIVGDGPGRAGIETLVRECGLEASVHLVGLRTNVAAFLETLDVFVLPSRAEGMSNALLEALLLGKPSIATRFGLPRDASGGDVVLPVEAEDAEALSAAMLRVRTDAALREDLRRRAGDYAAGALDVKRMAREYETLYRTLARGETAAGAARGGGHERRDA